MMQILMQLAEQAKESDEERAGRLQRISAQSGVEGETLYLVEEDVQEFAEHLLDENEDELPDQKEQLAPMVGVEPDEMNALAANLIAQYIVQKPEMAAEVVANLSETFDRRGLYDEAGVQSPEGVNHA